MRIALIGATGYVGTHLRDEALSRKHEVTAIVRNTERLPVRTDLIAVKGDVYDTAGLVKILAGHDAVVSAFSADKNADIYEKHVAGAKSIIAATKQAGLKRLLVVGGAGSLEAEPGKETMDLPDFPEEWKAGARAAKEFLILLRQDPDLDWTYLSPAAELEPGERTGRFRLGGDRLLVDKKGQSRISLQDYAVAMIDELEEPAHTRQRFSVAY